MRKLFTGLLLLLTAAGGSVVAAGTASATDGAGCPSAETTCYGWSKNWNRPDKGQYGAISYFADGNNEACDLKLDPYLGGGAGSGTPIGNNDGSLMVNKLDHSVTFYYRPSASGCRRPGSYSTTYGFGVRTCLSNPDTDWGVLPWYLCNNTRSHFVN
ncbi:hypothetical protein ACFWY9_35435 [Amycolatopsis sp. NPDC059027]|uniref:hypothetical protein n=1 Tax=unclassified Amycolatopsis TaxID=2618356 RepID=UPI00366DE6D2